MNSGIAGNLDRPLTFQIYATTNSRTDWRMMEIQGAGQAPLFYAFNLEDHIPTDHLLRGMTALF